MGGGNTSDCGAVFETPWVADLEGRSEVVVEGGSVLWVDKVGG